MLIMRQVLRTVILAAIVALTSLSADATGNIQALTGSPAIVGGQLLYCPTAALADYKCTFSQVATFIGANLSDFPAAGPFYWGTGSASAYGPVGAEVDFVESGSNLFFDAYRDATSFTTTGSGGYATWDSIFELKSSGGTYGHARSYQSRPLVDSGATVTELDAWSFSPTVNGTLTNMYGGHCYDPTGTGTVTTNACIWSDQTSGFSFYVASTNVQFYNGGLIHGGNGLTIDAGGAAITGQVNSTAIGTNGPPASYYVGGGCIFAGLVSTNTGHLDCFSDAGATYKWLGVNPNGTYGSGGGLLVNLDAPVSAASLEVAGPIQDTQVLAVASLPSCGSAAEGMWANVNNALSPTALATVSAGGSVHVKVYCNGSNWIVE
jgi:hypothetical protein